MSDFIQPYNNDTSVGLLSTPINTSPGARTFLKNLPLYRKGLSPLLRGLEVGMAHGYFLMGPFLKLGPLRNSEYGALSGFLSVTGLVIILAVAMTIYGVVIYQDEYKLKTNVKLQKLLIFSRVQWNQFIAGFLVGCGGSAGLVYVIIRFFIKY